MENLCYTTRINGRLMISKEKMSYLYDLHTDTNDGASTSNDKITHEDDHDLRDSESQHSVNSSNSNIFESESENISQVYIENTNSYYGRTNFKWSKTPLTQSCISKQNILRMWNLLINEEMIHAILEHTNSRITDMSVAYENIF